MYEQHQKVFEACKQVTPKRFELKLEDFTDVPDNEDTYEINVYEDGKKTGLHILCTDAGYTISCHSYDGEEVYSRIVNKDRWPQVVAHYMLVMKEHLS